MELGAALLPLQNPAIVFYPKLVQVSSVQFTPHRISLASLFLRIRIIGSRYSITKRTVC
jgi:hypothetical protein